MQVHACLRSIERFAPYGESVAVLYKASNSEFADAYRIVAEETSAEFIAQSDDFRRHVLQLIGAANDHIVFHTDDDVFFRGTPLVPELTDQTGCFSFRLGLNTTYSYPADRPQAVPNHISADDVIAWDWTQAQHDFGYPLSLDGHVMRTSLLLRLLGHMRFANPNELEEELALKRYLVPRWMMSFSESCLVSIPVNIVSGTHTNRAGGDPEMSPQALNARFLAGERIDLDAMDFSGVRAAHQEIPLVFGQSSG
ncbi:MAG: hypothetical protein ACJ752_09715 [Gaiellaceae bacterium]